MLLLMPGSAVSGRLSRSSELEFCKMVGEAQAQDLQDKAVRKPHFVMTLGDIQCHGCC